MSSWSRQRKTLYLSIVLVILIGAIGVPLFLYFYTPPTCFDGILNGNEQGIDCGGSCERLCQSAFLRPDVTWTRMEEVAPGLYNVGAYIINPNAEGEARNVPYKLVLYDQDGLLLKETSGNVTIPPNRRTLAFKGAVSVGKTVPSKALFEFVGEPNWSKKKDTLGSLEIVSKKYSEDELSSSLVVAIKNNGLYAINNIGVSAVLYDQSNNALSFSKTSIDSIVPGSTALAPFTWPISHKGKVISIEVLPVAE